MTSKLAQKLRNEDYRTAFVSSQIEVGIPFQIRALMKQRGWTQGQLAEKAGMRQPSISALITPGKVKPNIETLRRLAQTFDCGLAVRFVRFGELADWSDEFDPQTFSVPGFEDELTQLEQRQRAEEKTGDVEFPPMLLRKFFSGALADTFRSVSSPLQMQACLRLTNENRVKSGCTEAEDALRFYAGPTVTGATNLNHLVPGIATSRAQDGRLAATEPDPDRSGATNDFGFDILRNKNKNVIPIPRRRDVNSNSAQPRVA